MPEGGCLCGAVRVEYTGEPAAQGICHCGDCRKISGSAFSINTLVPEPNLKVLKGLPKTFEKKADSGKNIKSFFCEVCGTTVYRSAELYPGLYIVKAGTMDVVDFSKPSVESYADSRLNWIPVVDGAHQIPRPS